MLAIFTWVLTLRLCLLCAASANTPQSACAREAVASDACSAGLVIASADLASSAGSLIQVRKADGVYDHSAQARATQQRQPQNIQTQPRPVHPQQPMREYRSGPAHPQQPMQEYRSGPVHPQQPMQEYRSGPVHPQHPVQQQRTPPAALAEQSVLGKVLRSAASKPKNKKSDKKSGKKGSGGDDDDKSPCDVEPCEWLEPVEPAVKKPKDGRTKDCFGCAPWEQMLDEDYVRDSNNPFDNRKYKPKESSFVIKGGSGGGSSGCSCETDFPACGPCPGTQNDDGDLPPVDVEYVPGRGPPEEPEVYDDDGPEVTPVDDDFDVPSPTPAPSPTAVTIPYCETKSTGEMSLAMNQAPDGTPCLFGVDPRDGGGHCILDGENNGAYGWCYTAEDKSTWGSCNNKCPGTGYDSVIERRIENLNILIMKTIERIETKTHPCELPSPAAKGGDEGEEGEKGGKDKKGDKDKKDDKDKKGDKGKKDKKGD